MYHDPTDSDTKSIPASASASASNNASHETAERRPSTIPNSVLAKCESTNDVVKSLGDQHSPHGTWISARTQASARGRHGRKWEAPIDNLYLSILARPKDNHARWSWIPITTAVSVAQVILEAFPSLPIQVKWPNDLWLDSAKLGGILCEGFPRTVNPFVVIGIGLNVSQAPQGLGRPVAALADALRQRSLPLITVDTLRPLILTRVLKNLDALNSVDGSKIIQETYDSFALFQPGTEISWANGQYTGKVLGLGPQGELEVRRNSLEIDRLFAEEVSVRYTQR